MKYVLGDIVKHDTGIVGEIIGVIRYNPMDVIEYLVDYGNGKFRWSLEKSLEKAELGREGEYD